MNRTGITEDEFEQYRIVQKSGAYNMYDPRARAMTDLSKNKWSAIMQNYNFLKSKYEPEKKTSRDK